eukprot:scaffold3.g6259.t1
MSFFDAPPGTDKYELEDEVGHGAFSEVHRARDRATGELVALKHMHLDDGMRRPLHVRRELAALQAVRHPNLVSLLGAHEQEFGISLALEYCLTDLRQLLEAGHGAPLEPGLAKAVASQLLTALAALHAAGYAHRDVAPSNLLISPAGLLKLADLGQARRLASGGAAREGAAAGHASAAAGRAAEGAGEGAAPNHAAAADHGTAADRAAGGENQDGAGALTPWVGTRWYRAPELLFGARAYTPAVDMWSAACVIAEMLGGRPLFPGTSDIDQLCHLAAQLGSVQEEAWPGVRDLPDWGKLSFPARDPAPLASALPPGTDPAALDLLQSLLRYDPAHRLSAAQALAHPYFAGEPVAAAPEALVAAARAAAAPRRP